MQGQPSGTPRQGEAIGRVVLPGKLREKMADATSRRNGGGQSETTKRAWTKSYVG